jgi:drug/metabolite transporter (DMT)-like permease
LTAVLLALGASASWGVADFVGPLKGRTLGALRVLLWAQIGGFAAIAAVVALRGNGPPHDAAVLLAVPAALSGTLGLYAYYRGIAVGAISIVAPIAGVSAAIPVAFGIASGDRPSVAQWLGVACALVGVALASVERTEGRERAVAAGVGLAALAAIGFGFYFPPMHAAGVADPWWASLVFRATSLALVAGTVAVRRPALRVGAVDGAVVVGVGAGDMLGNLLFAAAATRGLVSITSVLASLYPIVTVLLATAFLGERVARVQRLGIVLTLAGVALISG